MLLLTTYLRTMSSTSTSVHLLNQKSGVPSKPWRIGKQPIYVDSIHAEMLKAGLKASTKVLTALRTIQDKEISEDWSNGLIVKLPKRPPKLRQLARHPLLSIPSNVFCRVLLSRIDIAIDTKLRQEQLGFRKGRWLFWSNFCAKEHHRAVPGWKTPLYITFIDFHKASDGLPRHNLWKILFSYGVPSKMVTLIVLPSLSVQRHSEFFIFQNGSQSGLVSDKGVVSLPSFSEQGLEVQRCETEGASTVQYGVWQL